MKHGNYSTGLWSECDDQILGEDGLVIFRATENVLVKDQHRANVQRDVACANAFDGIETERLAGKTLGEFLAGEVRLNKAEPKPDGSFGFTFSGFAVQILAESFADQFRESGAVNYLELLFEHDEIGPLTVTMQRAQGLTPAQKLARVEDERDELARQVSALQLSHDNIINSLGIKGDGPVSKLVIEYVMGLVAENAAMDKFVDQCLKVAWDGGSLDGGEVQDIGLKNGLLREETYSADQHENLVEDPSNFEDGDVIYFRTEMTGTGAAIAEIKAQGVDEFVAHCQRQLNTSIKTKSDRDKFNAGINTAAPFAANLRAGRKG